MIRKSLALICAALLANAPARAGLFSKKPKEATPQAAEKKKSDWGLLEQSQVNKFFKNEIGSRLTDSAWTQGSQYWGSLFSADLKALVETAHMDHLPIGADASALEELNRSAADFWDRVVAATKGDLQKVRRAYIFNESYSDDAKVQQEIVDNLAQVRASFHSFIETTKPLEGPALFKTYSLPGRSLSFHPFFAQLLVEELARARIFIVVDEREDINSYAVISKVSASDFYKEKLHQVYPIDKPYYDIGVINGWIPVLSGPDTLRNTMLLMSLMSSHMSCEGWGLFPTASHSIVFDATAFAIGNIVDLNTDLPLEVRNGWRNGVGDLREVGRESVMKSIESDCGELEYQSFAYQKSSLIIKKYRELWNNN